MSEFGGDEWVGIIRPKSFLITRDDKLQFLSALEMYYSASTAADSSSDSVSPLVLARTCSFCRTGKGQKALYNHTCH
jgi:hypothetical protein